MKNLLNCHSIGLHSFPVSFENGLYTRIFFAAINHNLWKPGELAIHPHHVDIKITVLEGTLINPIYEISENGDVFNKYLWNSHILNGQGGFEYLEKETLKKVSQNKYGPGESITMKACELHTVKLEKGKRCVWEIQESKPTCEYLPINYSKRDLSNWSPEGLYIEVNNEIKNLYIGKYLSQPIH